MHVVATAGHVDHGKSTLVRALTGMEPDRWAEERRRGLTIDLGFAWTVLPGGDALAFVDVPGHERFVANMLAGVGPVPATMFVVAADEGWMPQSAEHLDALDALAVRHGLLVITRSDLFEPTPAREEALARLAGTSLEGVPAVCVSGRTGAGLDELRGALADLAAGLPAPDTGADVRLWVDRAFGIRGSGTVLTGTLPAGRLRVGDELELAGNRQPRGRRVRVRGLQSLGEPQDEVAAVARVAVNLRGVSLEDVGRGDTLLTPGRWLRTTTLDARLTGLHGPVGRLPRELILHVGSAAAGVQVRPLGGDTARLTLGVPLPLRIGDRGVLRDPGRRRVAAGVLVLDVAPPALARRGAAAARAAELAALTGVPDAAGELARRGVVRVADLVAMGAATAEPSTGEPAGGWLLDDARADQLAGRLVTALSGHEAANPLDPGMPIQAAQRAVGLPDPALVGVLLRRPAAAGLTMEAGRIRRSSSGSLPPEVRTALLGMRADLAADPFAAPTAERLRELGLGPRELATLVRAGELLRVGDGIYLLPGADAAALDRLAELPGPFTLSAARQALGTSRRVAVPLLELLARGGHTARTADGNHRLR